jgi:hypothetical protein
MMIQNHSWIPQEPDKGFLGVLGSLFQEKFKGVLATDDPQKPRIAQSCSLIQNHILPPDVV